MSNNSKKYISLTRLSDFLDNIKEKFSQIGHKHTTADITDYTPISVDTELSSTSTNPVQNKVLDAEFDAIGNAMGALELAIDGKADIGHNHDDLYYTEEEIDEKINEVKEDATNRDIVVLSEAQKEIDNALDLAKEYTDTVTSGKADANHNHDDIYDASGSAESALASAKAYADSAAQTVKNDLLNGAGDAYDTLKELGNLIDENHDAIDALEEVATNKADKTHSHAISDVSGLQSALDGKASTEDLISAINEAKEDASNKDVVVLLEAQKSIDAVQTRADDAYALAESKVGSLSDLGVTATTVELNYVDGVTSNIQTQLDGKQETITGAATTVTGSNLTTNRALISNDSGKIAVSDITSTELGYLDGVTSNIQTQLDNKAKKSQGVYYIEGTKGTYSEDWLGTHEDITEYYAGLVIAYKTPSIGASGIDETWLNINNLGWVYVVANDNASIGTNYSVGSVLLLVYTVDSSGTAYWKIADNDTKNTAGTEDTTGTKLYLAGGRYQNSYGTTTYSNNKVYIGTDNCLYSNGKKVITTDDELITIDDIDTICGASIVAASEVTF